LDGWSEAKIIAAITELHRSQHSLKYSEVRRKWGALISAAEAYFGSWGRALRAAGIDPEQHNARVYRFSAATLLNDLLPSRSAALQ
jgi:hypothetical protein